MRRTIYKWTKNYDWLLNWDLKIQSRWNKKKTVEEDEILSGTKKSWTNKMSLQKIQLNNLYIYIFFKMKIKNNNYYCKKLKLKISFYKICFIDMEWHFWKAVIFLWIRFLFLFCADTLSYAFLNLLIVNNSSVSWFGLESWPNYMHCRFLLTDF